MFFNQIETGVVGSQSFDQSKLPDFIALTWNKAGYNFICTSDSLRVFANRIEAGTIDVSIGMYVYYLIMYNRIHLDDWGDARNYLAEKILGKL